METATQNNPFNNSILSSQYLNPEYLFNHGVAFINQLIVFFTNDQAVNIERAVLFFLALFFLAIICYAIIVGVCFYMWRITKYNLRDSNLVE